MASVGFQFKHFYIEHSQCAMKVGTDSIMLGSWIVPQASKNILDIGTGSGLLALMLAQKTAEDCNILGIDIDSNAVLQAQINAKNSPWEPRLTFVHLPLQTLRQHSALAQKFDLIMCNPPYFAENHKTNQQNAAKQNMPRIQARQVSALTHTELLQQVDFHLAQSGSFYCVLPSDTSNAFIEKALKQGLFLQHQIQVRSTEGAKIIRQMMKFSRYSTQAQCDNLVIYTQPKQYSQQYIELCKAYYLRF
ncbi:tRNA1(Val) (adenine(37)-N6)-methyltransferase [Flavobacterium sp. W21_SRS_FM6]|uniref:tRNA1(Val) (adenine(37)-N6)-methyltransferase n=1 Tax=Flavobacterium sp. W21_SRS_FM6 TaxID=3240268 RepID=UPI003F8E9C23